MRHCILSIYNKKKEHLRIKLCFRLYIWKSLKIKLGPFYVPSSPPSSPSPVMCAVSVSYHTPQRLQYCIRHPLGPPIILLWSLPVPCFHQCSIVMWWIKSVQVIYITPDIHAFANLLYGAGYSLGWSQSKNSNTPPSPKFRQKSEPLPPSQARRFQLHTLDPLDILFVLCKAQVYHQTNNSDGVERA